MMNMRIIRTVLLVAAGLLLAACAPDHGGDEFTGYVEAEYVYVAAPSSGWVRALEVKEGDLVAPGAVLFELDKTAEEAGVAEAAARAAEAGARARDLETGARMEEIAALEADLQEAKARLVLAQSEKDRWMPLVRAGDASSAKGDQVTSDYEAAQARVKAAQEAIDVARLGGREAAQDAAIAAKEASDASLAAAEWRLRERSVDAETGGRVEEIFHRQGEFVSAGAPVLALLPPDHLKVRFFVPQAALKNIAPGGQVRIAADNGVETTARISFVASEAEFTPPVIYSAKDRDKLVFLVEARLPSDAGLRPGLPVDVRLSSVNGS